MKLWLVAGLSFVALGAASAQTPQAAAPAPNSQAFARVVDLGQNVSMLMGQGGNLGLLTGPDGVFMIDDQYATNATANLAKIEELTKGKPKFLINTHWHFDHAGGNDVFGRAGATIFAHENVRKRLTNEVKTTGRTAQAEPAPRAAWPVHSRRASTSISTDRPSVRCLRPARRTPMATR